MLKRIAIIFTHLFVTSLAVTVLLTSSNSAFAFGEPWSKDINRSRGEDLSVRLVTYGQGDIVPEKFGHTALWVTDTKLNYERLYNFGMFSFDNTLIPQFLSGKLRFWIGQDLVVPTFHSYQKANRDIIADELNIPPAKRLELARTLSENTLPENRYYIYDHFYDNCSTRIRDIINDASGNTLYNNSVKKTPFTLRDFVTIYTSPNPLVYFALTFWMNDEIDHQVDYWDAMFLPLELHKRLLTTKYHDGTSLVSNSETIYQAVYRQPVAKSPPVIWPYCILTSFVVLLIAALATLRYTSQNVTLPRIVLGLLQFGTTLYFGLLGSIAVLFLFTEHKVTYYNLNILLANPITLVLSFLAIGIVLNSKWAMRTSKYLWTFLAGTSIACLIGAPFLPQDCSVALAMLVPYNLGFTTIFWLIDSITESKSAQNQN